MDTAGEEPLTDYELQRQQLIARNRARLIALGIPDAVSGLAALQSRPKAAPHAPKRPRHDVPEEPSRQSARVRNREMEERGEVPPDVEPGSELGRFIVEGDCPKCGRVISAGHRQHLERCKGRPPAPPPPTEEEIAEQGGLVEFGDDGAVFIVIGSTGNHYVVRLSDSKRACTCIDHRIRKRDCKHIKLILGQLGVADQPLGSYDWRGGVQRISEQLNSAPEEDIHMVQQADARRAAAAAKRTKAQGSSQAAAPGTKADKEAADNELQEGEKEEEEKDHAGGDDGAKGRASRRSNAGGKASMGGAKGTGAAAGASKARGKRKGGAGDSAGKHDADAPVATTGVAAKAAAASGGTTRTTRQRRAGN